MDPQWSRLGALIRRDRQRARMSQDALATASRVSKRTIGNYERGDGPANSSPIPGGYYSVADVLGWAPQSIDDILAGAEEPTYRETAATPAGELASLARPAFAIADLARDAGAPADLIDRFRGAAIELVAWVGKRLPDEGDAVGAGVPPDDAERILGALEADARIDGE